MPTATPARVPSAFEWAAHPKQSVMHDDPRNKAYRHKNMVRAGLKPAKHKMVAAYIDPNPAASRAKTASIKTPTTVRGGK